MRRLRAWALRLLHPFGGSRADRDLKDELECHLALHIEDNLRAGMEPAEARRAALLKLGGIAQVMEAHRDRRGVPLLDHLAQDLRCALRMFRKDPTFTSVAVLTLGLGIGANAAIFSVVNAVLLRPLPFPRAGRLVMVFATNERERVANDVTSYPNFEHWRTSTTGFERMAAFTSRGATLAGDDQAEIVGAVQATAGFFETLGVEPAIGRSFGQAEQTGGSRVAVLADGAWHRYFGGRDDVLGQSLRISEQPYRIIGVMPPGFRFLPDRPEQVYVPLAPDPDRRHGFLRVLGRLRPEASLASARSEMAVIARQLAQQYPDSNRDVGANVVPLVEAMTGDARYGLLVFLGVVTLVLLIACANVANLTLARNARRQTEFAVRTALGAGRGRLVRQLLTESAVLGLAGGCLALSLTEWTGPALASLLATSFPIPRIETTRTDIWVLGFTLAVSLATAVLFGILHALDAASAPPNEGLRDSPRSAAGSARSRRMRAILVVTETALALVLLSGAGALLKGLIVLRTTAPGFTPLNRLTVSFWLPKSRMANASARSEFYEQLLTRVKQLGSVASAALVANPPLSGGYDTLGFHIPGRPDPADGYFNANFNLVTAGYFHTLGIPIRAGRDFTAEDTANASPVVIINQTAARQFWPGQDPVGGQILLPESRGTGRTLTVIGVVGDVRQLALGRLPRPEIFLDFTQPTPDWPWVSLVVRTTTDPMQAVGSIKAVARSVDRDAPIARIGTFDEAISGSLVQPRVYTQLLGAFAALALTLAAVGLYGVVSYTVAQRTHEMGIRMALGARPADLLHMILRQGLRLAVIGSAVGLAGGVALTRLLSSLLPGVEPNDPWTLVSVCALLLGVSIAASYLPARRGSRIDPLVCVRQL